MPIIREVPAIIFGRGDLGMQIHKTKEGGYVLCICEIEPVGPFEFIPDKVLDLFHEATPGACIEFENMDSLECVIAALESLREVWQGKAERVRDIMEAKHDAWERAKVALAGEGK